MNRSPAKLARLILQRISGWTPATGGWMAIWLGLVACLTVSATPPPPMAMWTFEDGPRDQVGALHGQLVGGARIAEGRLLLDGTGYLRTPPLPVSLTAKTLVARVRVDPLTQGGGGVLTVQVPGGWVFDSIVYGEREPRKWIAGSEFFNRTRDLAGAPLEDRTNGFVHMAIVYAADGGIAVYRDGVPYGTPYRPTASATRFEAGNSEVLMGLRHVGGANLYLRGEIEEAALYGEALTAADVAELAAGPVWVDNNLISNGGFEKGALTGWEVAGHLGSGTNVPAVLVGSPVAAQGRFSAFPVGGVEGLRLSQVVSVEPGREHVLSFAYLALDPAPGSFGVEVNGVSLGDEVVGEGLPASSGGIVRTNWAYGRRGFIPTNGMGSVPGGGTRPTVGTTTNGMVEVAFRFPPEMRGKIRFDDVRLEPATNGEPAMVVSLAPGTIAIREQEPAWLVVRRTGRLHEVAYATLELEAGTAAVAGGEADLVFLDAPGRSRVGVVFMPGESAVRIGIVGRPDAAAEGLEEATARLVATGNARVGGEPVLVRVSDPPSLRGGMEFNGIDQSVVIAHDPALNSFPLTASCWLKTTHTAHFSSLFSKYISGQGNGWSVHLMEGRIRAMYFRDWSSSVWGGDAPMDHLNGGFVADGEWHHVAFVLDGDGGRLFVDGVFKDSFPWRGLAGPASSSVKLAIGCAPLLEDGTGVAHYRGRMDEVRIWSRAMSDLEVRNSMFGSLTGNEAGLVAHYDFNQNGGTTLTNRAATGSKFDGVLSGSTLPRFVDVEDASEVPGPLVVNGGFENGTLAPWRLTGDPRFETNPPLPWLSLSHSAQLVRSFASTFSSGEQRLSQTLATEPGKEYRLTFAYGVKARVKGTLGVEVGGVALDGVPLDAGTLLPLGSDPSTGTWLYATRVFTAVSNATELTFVVPSVLSAALHIDDVEVVPATETAVQSVVELEPGPLRVEEGNLVTVTLRRTGRLELPSFATLVLEPGTAVVSGAGTDLHFHVRAAGSRIGVKFEWGQEVRTVQLMAREDSEAEVPETATVRLLPTGNAQVKGDPVEVTVVTPPTRVAVAAPSSVAEAVSQFSIGLEVARGSAARVRVETTRSGTATPGEDFTPVDVEMDVIPGRASSLPITMLKDDRIEGIETIGVRVTAISADTEILGSEFFIQIRDASEVSIVPGVVESPLSESAASARFVIRRFGAVPTAQNFRVRYQVGGAESGDAAFPGAREGKDFVATKGEVEFGAGITERFVEVPLLNDAEADGIRGLTLRLIGSPDFPDSAGIGWGEATVTLLDDERTALWQEVAMDLFRPGWWRDGQEGLSLPGGKSVLVSGLQVLRLTASGLPDPDFGGGTGQVRFADAPEMDGSIRAIRGFADGRIVFIDYGWDGRVWLVRLTDRGELDPSFGGGSGIAMLPEGMNGFVEVSDDGSTLFGWDEPLSGRRLMRRLLPDGNEDPGFAWPDVSGLGVEMTGTTGAIQTAPDGRLWLASQDPDIGVRMVLRLEANGQVASGVAEWPGISRVFGFDGLGRAYCQVDPNGGWEGGGDLPGGIVRFLADGSLDADYRAFAEGGFVPSAIVEADGSLLGVRHADGWWWGGTWSLIEIDPAGGVRSERTLPGSSPGFVSALRRLEGGRILMDVLVPRMWSHEYTRWIFDVDGRLSRVDEPESGGWMQRLSWGGTFDWSRVDPGVPTPLSGGGESAYTMWRPVVPNAESEVGLVKSGVFVRGAAAQIPAWRTGSTAQAARIRGKLIPRGRRGWDEAAAVPFESGFEVGRAEAMLELELPASVRRAGVREFLVRLEGAEGAGLSALTECRVWSIEADGVPAMGELRMVKMSAPDTQGTSLLMGTWEGFSSDALQAGGSLEGPYVRQGLDSFLTVDGLWMLALPDEEADGQFFRLKR